MDLRELTGRAASRIKEVFSKDNRFFYGNNASHQDEYQQDVHQAPAQGVYQNAYAQQPQYAQQAAPQQQAYNPYTAAPQQQAAQYQQTPYQQLRQQPMAEYQQAWQQPQPAYQAPQMQQGYVQQPVTSPQQVQYSQQAEQQGRNRRAAQHMQEPQAEGNIVQFPGVTPETETKPMDAYVVNITNINGCRQAMTCLRKGQCTLVVMDQLIDKAEVRRYVDMLNGACFALGGTMTRLSLKIGFYLLAPSGMMVYTDPLTASANNLRPQQQPQAAQQPMQQQPVYQSQPGFQQPAYQQQPAQQAYYAQPQQPAPNPYAPPSASPQDYVLDPYDAKRYAQ